jgi:hypothetical protein
MTATVIVSELLIPGYRVRVACGMPDWRQGFWTRRMDEFVGKTGTVLEYRPDYDVVKIEFLNTDSEVHILWYPRAVLEIVDRGNYLPGHGPNNTHLFQELPP